MPKEVLGRGLGNLMGGAKPVSEPRDANPPPSKVSPGMATLLQGRKKEANGGAEQQPQEGTPRSPETDQQPVESAQSSQPYRKFLRISLFVADGLLLLLAARVAFKSGGSFGFPETALCAGALAMGAWLAVVALHMKN